MDVHRTLLGVGVDLRLRPIDRQLRVIGADAVPVRVRVAEDASEQHLVRARADARHQVGRLERALLDLGVKVLRVLVQGHRADLDQRVVLLRPDLGQIERVVPVRLGIVVRHDLHLDGPAREVAVADRSEQVLTMVIGRRTRQLVGLVLGQALDALVRLEVELDPRLRAVGGDELVRVRTVSIHVTERLRDSAVTHQPGHLVRRLGRQGPEIPLHVVVSKTGIGHALLTADEVLELQWIAHEEHRRVVADHVPVALGGVELQRETAGVAPRVGAALLARDGGEARQHLGLRAGLEHRRPRVLRDVTGDLERAEGACTLGVHHTLRDPLTVELRHLLDEVVIVQQDRSLRTRSEGVLVAGNRDTGVVGRGPRLCHESSASCSWQTRSVAV